MTHLFTYGTLMHPLVWNAVVERAYESKPFTIYNYCRRSLKERAYPALIHEQDKEVRGLLYLDIDDDDLLKIDAFEGSEYRRIPVLETTVDSEVQINTYLFTGDSSILLEKDWDLDQFILSGLENFTKNFAGWTR